MRNWRTTTAGILAAVGALATAIARQIDGDPATDPGWSVVVPMIVGAVGLLVAADARGSK